MNSDSYDAPATRELLGPLRQLGYIVDDVEAAAHDWVRRFGVAPWRVISRVPFDTCQYRGNTIAVEVSIASAYSNGIEIELIGQQGGPASMYTDHLADHGPGAQHACFFPADYDAACRHLTSTGMEPILDGAIAGIRFSYFGDGRGQLIELADVSPEGLIARAARATKATEWDGSDPVRVS